MSGGSQKFNMKTVLVNGRDNGGGSSMASDNQQHIITGLKKFTEYEVFLMPFFRRMEGQPSNSLHVQTLEDVPSAPPGNVAATDILNFTSAVIRWSPPPPQHRY